MLREKPMRAKPITKKTFGIYKVPVSSLDKYLLEQSNAKVALLFQQQLEEARK